jgi:hypothetical protein
MKIISTHSSFLPHTPPSSIHSARQKVAGRKEDFLLCKVNIIAMGERASEGEVKRDIKACETFSQELYLIGISLNGFRRRSCSLMSVSVCKKGDFVINYLKREKDVKSIDLSRKRKKSF